MDHFSNLTPKQALFCDEYFKDFNASKAALRAGYSAATALSGNLMLLPKIKYHLQQRGAEAAEQAQVTHQMVLAELKVVALARMSAFFGEDGQLKAMHEVDENTKGALLNYTVTEDRNGSKTIKIRMNNKLSALDKIAKHLKFYDTEHPAHSAKYWIVDGPALDEHDRYDDDSVESRETEIKNQEAEREAEMNRRVAEATEKAIAETEQRMKAEFELKLKEVKKAAKEKMKNTHEYPRVGGDKKKEVNDQAAVEDRVAKAVAETEKRMCDEISNEWMEMAMLLDDQAKKKEAEEKAKKQRRGTAYIPIGEPVGYRLEQRRNRHRAEPKTHHFGMKL
jgi:hypothetical protein